jgi:diguanylate cyclase (GGDEF)-like protein/PAS domain S-box-containing protein
MDRFKFPIWAKVAVAFTLVVLIVVAVGSFTMCRLHAISVRAATARDDSMPSALALGQLRTSVRQYRLAEATLLLARSDAEFASDLTLLRTGAIAVRTARAACKPLVTPGTDDVRYAREFDHAWAAWQTASEHFIANAVRRSHDHEDFDASNGYYEAAIEALTRNIASNTHTAVASADAGVQYIARTQAIDAGALVVVIVTSIALGLALTRTVSIPLRIITAAMRRLAARDFTVLIPRVGRGDEFGTMAAAIEVFRASLIETDQMRARQDAKNAELRESEARFRTVFSSVIEGIFVSDSDTGRFLEVNQGGCEMFGYTYDELIGRDIASLSSGTNPYTQAGAQEWILKARARGPQTFEWHSKAKNGRLFWSEVCIRCTTYGNRQVVLATLRDISERKEAEAQIVRLARYDLLTGLPNRGVFIEAIRQAAARAERDGRLYAVLFLDLDHFKDVNDTLGHPAGDELLRAVAGRLRGALRDSDVVARFGGDEFAALVELHEPSDAATLATDVIGALKAPFAIQGNQICIGTSIGIAVHAPGADVETLMSHADVALYRAKSDGRGGYRYFEDFMDSETRARVKLIAELRAAIKNGQLFLKYQPQVELVSGRIKGLEALVRWRHPERGVLGPEEFISAAESGGLIVSLGRTVLREACRQARQWDDAGILPATLAVNLSAGELHAPEALEEFIATTLAETGLRPERLEIELTETVLMEAGSAPHSMLARLRARGIRLAIDDFGTGFSSLDYLRRFCTDRIKIAGCFVNDIEQRGDAAVVRATIGLAQELGMAVIAEGVETERQVELLSAWGCTECQGFYYAQPLEAAALEPLLRAGVAGRELHGVRGSTRRGRIAGPVRSESPTERYPQVVERAS